MLKLDKVTIRFGGLVAVNEVSTRIREGQIFGLIGPNGAGKTTIFNIVSGVYAPTSGAIHFMDQPIHGKRPNEINRLGLARTYQNINLFKKMTVLENVMVGCHSVTEANFLDAVFNTKRKVEEERRVQEKCMKLLDFVQLSDKQSHPAASLSYGEQRKLEIVRAMASEPRLLLLDEPAAGMNLAEKEELSRLIFEIRALGYTILLVEHHMRLVMKVCDEICVINYGAKICQGSPEHVQRDEQVIAAYLGGVKDGQ